MITVRKAIMIRRTIEDVWDFTQDYPRRSTWDRSIRAADLIKSDPPRIASVVGRGNWRATFRYKLDDRPNKSSLVMEDVSSSLFLGGGGSWKYEFIDGVTIWEQTNTLVLKPGPVTRIFRPLIAAVFKKQTWRAMQRVKFLMESNPDLK